MIVFLFTTANCLDGDTELESSLKLSGDVGLLGECDVFSFSSSAAATSQMGCNLITTGFSGFCDATADKNNREVYMLRH